jgi:hypothetical protein
MKQNALITNMTSTNAPNAERRSNIRPVNNPLAWIGADRLLLDDVTVYGLRRQVVAHKVVPPNVDVYLRTVESRTTANVYAWCVLKDDGYWYLWIVWKEQPL